MKFKTSRLEALTDGIFAIIMTVLLVGLSEVFNLSGSLSQNDLVKFFIALKEDFGVYILTFLVLGVFWLEHHWQFHFIKHADAVLVFINISWFMVICILPFTALLMGNHGHLAVVVFLFELNILLSSLILYIHWLYASNKHHLLDAEVSKEAVSSHREAGLFLITICVLALIVTFWNVLIGLLVLAMSPLVFIFYRKSNHGL
ncbi:MAG: DUF1211 domain-containing protein [Candidatus Omnitrophica bacterium]|nr:DUF1211 domain-containing protein [Candidatus Omnitrophota bacterium]